jgi:hypothetical protein
LLGLLFACGYLIGTFECCHGLWCGVIDVFGLVCGKLRREEKVSDDRVVLYMLPACAQVLSQDSVAATLDTCKIGSNRLW